MDCEERLKNIVDGFQRCRNAFTAIGDETRQLILLVLLASDLSGIRVRRNCRKSTSDKAFCFPSLTNSKEFRYCIHEKRRHKELLFFKYRRYSMEKHVRVDKPHL